MKQGGSSEPDGADELSDLLQRAGAAGTIALGRGCEEGLRRYAELLGKSGAAGSLVSSADAEPAAIRKHIEDSLAGVLAATGPWTGSHAVDIGAGHGMPGLVIALAQPEMAQMALVDSSARKAAFLRRAIIETGARAEVALGESPGIATDLGGARFGKVLVRALASPTVTIEHANQFLADDGEILYWFGRKEPGRVAEAVDACNSLKLEVDWFQPEMLESRGWIAIIRRCS